MSMADRDGFIWYDGKLVPWREANTHVLTHSLHYGLALFEGVRAYKTPQGTAIFRLKEHTERLFNSARVYMMEIPYSQELICDAQREVVRANKLESCYLRPLVFYGSEKMGVSPKGAQVRVAIAAWPWGAYLGEEGLTEGDPRQDLELPAPPHQRLDGADQDRRQLRQLDPRQPGGAQRGLRRGAAARYQRLRRRGCGREPLHRASDGQVYEPEMVSGLIGITRRSVIEVAHNIGYEVRAMPMTRDDVYLADEAFFTGTAAEITPIRELDRRVIGKGSRGPVTHKIQNAFFDVVNGKNPEYKHWLTLV